MKKKKKKAKCLLHWFIGIRSERFVQRSQLNGSAVGKRERKREKKGQAWINTAGRQQQTVWCSTLLVLEAKRNLIKQSTPSPVHRLVFISPFSTERRTLCHLNIQARLDAIVRFFLYSFSPFRYTPPFLLFFTESRRYRSQLEISDFIRFIDLFRRRQVQTANFIDCVKTFK